VTKIQNYYSQRYFNEALREWGLCESLHYLQINLTPNTKLYKELNLNMQYTYSRGVLMADDDYEILPHKEISELRGELTKLKEGNYGSSVSVHSSVDTLQTSINSLLDIFKEASRSMQEETDHHSQSGKRMDELMDKMDTMLEQNEKIAEGIVAIADMIKEAKAPAREPSSKPTMPPMADMPPPMPPQGMQNMPPPPRAMGRAPPPPPMSMPPPP
jgi:hypothetical protein